MKMFAILFVILMSSQIDCHSICETIKPNGVFNGLQIYQKYESTEKSHLIMDNRNGIEWQFNITLDGHSLKMNDSMVNTTVDALYRFGVNGEWNYDSIPFKEHQNCMIFAGNASHLRLKCEPRTQEFTFKIGDYVIVPWITKLPGFKGNTYIDFFDRKTKQIKLVYNPYHKKIDECKEYCDRKPPPFVEEMDNTLFSSIECVVDYISSDGKSHYFILFKIDGRPKFCITSDDGHISQECKSSEKLTNLFGECFETSHTPNSTPSSNTSLVWVLIAVALLVLVIAIAFGIVFMRRRRGQQFTDMSSFHMVSSKPTPKST